MSSSRLEQARAALAKFELDIGSKGADRYLVDGLDLLDEIVSESGSPSTIAKNLGETYAKKAMDYVERSLRNATQPELEHLFQLLIELEVYQFGDKNELSKLKVQVFKSLVSSYFAGYSEEEKKAELQRLLNDPDT